jgi:subtilisin family serine protease
MASIMVARPGPLGITGLAPAASILPLAVPLNGTTDGQHAAKVPAAIRWAVRHGAKVISMSIGGERFPGAGNRSCPAAEQRAVFAALAAGVVVIAAVGNTGPRANTVEEPGVCLGVVAVGAVDRAGAVAPFSARQPYLSLVAPGVDVPSLGRVAGQAFSGSGTSQAAALVSATAALVWSRYPRLSGREVVSRLLATVDRRGAERSAAYGSGELDAYRAVTATVSPSAPNPVYAAAAPFLRRAAALQRGLGRRPAPATSVRPRGGGKAPALIAPRPSSGGVATGAAEPRSPAAGASSLQLPIGIALASLGGVALLALGAVGLRRGASSRRSTPT